MAVVTMRLELIRPDLTALLVDLGDGYPPISVTMLTARALPRVDFFGVGAPCRVVEEMRPSLLPYLRIGEEPHPLIADDLVHVLGFAGPVDLSIILEIGADEFRHFLRIGDRLGEEQNVGIDETDLFLDPFEFGLRLPGAWHAAIAPT